MGDEPDLDPAINKDFFQNNILQLDPTLLTESGIKCYERFFKAVNSKEGKLKLKRRTFLMDDVDLIGTDYLWRVCSIAFVYFFDYTNFIGFVCIFSFPFVCFVHICTVVILSIYR